MFHPNHALSHFFAGVVRGLLRTSQVVLIAIGIITLTQLLPAARQSAREIDAMGGAMDKVVTVASAGRDDNPEAIGGTVADLGNRWLHSLRAQLDRSLALLGSEAVASDTPLNPPAQANTPKPAPDVARLTLYLANRYRVSDQVVADLIARATAAGRETGVDPLLIMSVIAIESGFNPLAQSVVGAQGLMQVIPRYHMDKLDAEAGTLALFEPETNIRVGALVLKEMIRRTDSLEAGLQNYAGASTDPEAGYARKVLGVREKLLQVMRG